MTLLFDLDGTLTASSEGIVKSVQYALAWFGIEEHDPARQRSWLGPPLRPTFARYGLSPAQVEEAVTAYRERFEAVGMFENRLYGGIPELLAELRDRGHTLAIASSKPEKFVRTIATHFSIDGYFVFMGGAQMDGGRSGKAEIIAYVLAALGVNPRGDARDTNGSTGADVAAESPPGTGTAAQKTPRDSAAPAPGAPTPGAAASRVSPAVWMIGDREHDILGAKAAGVHSIGVLYGYGSREELEAAGADRMAETVRKLGHLLTGLDAE
ncbi:MAG: HAD hydrolase-like protein [Oscillospiraceae bacterium]|nr:HAD hydrolase-like protein [Oscillospiraceae bacterium]